MKAQSRIENSIKNISIGLGGQVLSLLLSFINRTIFINTLGEQYLGINGLFSSILSVLSLAELGIGSAIIYNMYKPLADNDNKKIQMLINLYRNLYHIIGIVVGILGMLLIPFLDFVIKGNIDIPNLKIIYILFLSNSVLSYFFAYKRSILIADQKNYLINIYQYLFNIIQIIIQVVILKLTNNFIFYLLIQCISGLLLNIYISKQANKLYPFIRKRNSISLEKNEKIKIFKNVYAMFMYKINGVILNSTDNIVISMFIGISYVGLYSNYLLIVNSVIMILDIIFSSLTSSIGNLNAIESKAKKYEVFNTINFIAFWIYGFSSICLYCLLNPFIEVWLGKGYLLDNFTVLIIILNFYTSGMQYATCAYRDTTGLFWNGRYLPILASILNIFFSIFLAPKLGIAGVILGTILSRVFTYFWFDPKIIYKNIFNTPVKIYFLKYSFYTFIVIITGLISVKVTSIMGNISFFSFIISIILCVLISNTIFLIVFFRSKEFKQIIKIFFKIFKIE
ncbi:lipopolysaccharide biosynthesis protein [Clostridium perfringens]|uniref:lipopolysaccharide biosynthesis protein n=1 Tax=Clostridium perfringens TaxID=1502 RepID=UPI0024BC75E1|nr:sugar translocase [Clostridium perfringens]